MSVHVLIYYFQVGYDMNYAKRDVLLLHKNNPQLRAVLSDSYVQRRLHDVMGI